MSDREPLWDGVEEEKTVWTTKDGRTILVEEMTDVHLANTIAMLKRIEEPEEQFYSGDSFAAEQAVECENYQNRQLWEDTQDWIAVLTEEQKRRTS